MPKTVFPVYQLPEHTFLFPLLHCQLHWSALFLSLRPLSGILTDGETGPLTIGRVTMEFSRRKLTVTLAGP